MLNKKIKGKRPETKSPALFVTNDIEILLHSLPNEMKSTIPKEFKILIAPDAKFSALEIA